MSGAGAATVMRGQAGEAVFAFRGLGRFVALGVAGGLAQIGMAAYNTWAARRTGSGLGWVAAAGLAASGSAQALLLLGCRGGAVRLTEAGVAVRLGRLWRQTLPYAAIGRAEVVAFPLTDGFGIRTDFRGTVAVVPWGRRAVALQLTPPRDLPVIGFRQRDARALRLGLADPDGFVAALAPRLASAGPATR